MFCFAGMVRKKRPCQNVIGPFKFRAKFQSHWRFLFIIFIVYYMLNEIQVLQWQVPLLAIPKTWVRTPGLCKFHIIFQYSILCSANMEDASYTLKTHHPRVHQKQSKGHDQRCIIDSSQRAALYPGKSTNSIQMGQKSSGPFSTFFIFLFIFI